MLCMRVKAIIPVGQMSQAGVFDDFRGDVAKRASEAGELRENGEVLLCERWAQGVGNGWRSTMTMSLPGSVER